MANPYDIDFPTGADAPSVTALVAKIEELATAVHDSAPQYGKGISKGWNWNSDSTPLVIPVDATGITVPFDYDLVPGDGSHVIAGNAHMTWGDLPVDMGLPAGSKGLRIDDTGLYAIYWSVGVEGSEPMNASLEISQSDSYPVTTPLFFPMTYDERAWAALGKSQRDTNAIPEDDDYIAVTTGPMGLWAGQRLFIMVSKGDSTAGAVDVNFAELTVVRVG